MLCELPDDQEDVLADEVLLDDEDELDEDELDSSSSCRART
jgi:hypothetical protein